MVKIKFDGADVSINYASLDGSFHYHIYVSWKANITPPKMKFLHSKVGAAAYPTEQEEHNRLIAKSHDYSAYLNFSRSLANRPKIQDSHRRRIILNRKNDLRLKPHWPQHDACRSHPFFSFLQVWLLLFSCLGAWLALSLTRRASCIPHPLFFSYGLR